LFHAEYAKLKTVALAHIDDSYFYGAHRRELLLRPASRRDRADENSLNAGKMPLIMIHHHVDQSPQVDDAIRKVCRAHPRLRWRPVQ